MRVAVIGAGSWGTALALVLAEAGHEVVLWARTPEVARAINEEHRNPRYLSDYRLPSAIRATAEYAAACDGAEAVVIVTPSAALRSVAADLRELVAPATPIVICSKGVEEKTGLLPIDTFAAELGGAGRMAVLSGPTHAEEVICMSQHSRNRRFGEQYVARGLTLDDFTAQTHMVVEGAIACKTLATLEARYEVDLPLTDTVRSVVWEGVNPREAAAALIDRPLKSEFY